MTKYYFFVILVFCGIYGISQDCMSRNLLDVSRGWSGQLDQFSTNPGGPWQLADSLAGTAMLEHRADEGYTGLQISFSLDFPPSTANRFEVELDLDSRSGKGGSTLLLGIGEAGSQDGLTALYSSPDGVAYSYYFWEGEYAQGAKRASWDIRLTATGIQINRIRSVEVVEIPWGDGNAGDLVVSGIRLICQYTVTRSRHFFIHHFYTNPDQDYFKVPEAGSIFISECRLQDMTSPDFVEIYTMQNFESCINGLRLEVNGKSLDLPPIGLRAGEHLLIVDPHQPLSETPDVPHIFLDLQNVDASSSVEIILFYFDRPVHGLRLLPSQRPQDGRTVEMMDVTQPCRTDNWALSKVETGTPGNENSWFTTLGDPEIQFRWQTPAIGLLVLPYLIFEVEPLENLVTVNREFSWDSWDYWGLTTLFFTDELDSSEEIQFQIKGPHGFCETRVSWDTSFVVHPPERGKDGGLLITEIMYEPLAGCPEFLEITNLEDIPTWWQGLSIQKNENDPIPIFVDGGWPPNQSRVFTSDQLSFLECYPETDIGLIHEIDLFPLNNNGATLTLQAIDPQMRIIDETIYYPGLHNFLIKNTAGVVLERNIFGNMGNKWRSGFVQFAYRSPGFLPVWDFSAGIEINFSTSIVYMNVDREPSQLQISVEAGSLDGSITIDIFDISGNKIQTLANAVPVQGGEEFFWTGKSPNGRLFPEGLYLFWIYYFDALGHKKTVKKTCVLSNN